MRDPQDPGVRGDPAGPEDGPRIRGLFASLVRFPHPWCPEEWLHTVSYGPPGLEPRSALVRCDGLVIAASS